MEFISTDYTPSLNSSYRFQICLTLPSWFLFSLVSSTWNLFIIWLFFSEFFLSMSFHHKKCSMCSLFSPISKFSSQKPYSPLSFSCPNIFSPILLFLPMLLSFKNLFQGCVLYCFLWTVSLLRSVLVLCCKSID